MAKVEKTKVISAKFLNEFNKLVDKYNPDKELNELAQGSGDLLGLITNLSKEDERNDSLINSVATLLNLSANVKLDKKRKDELVEFNCKAYSMIKEVDYEEVLELDYIEVKKEVNTFRATYQC